MTTSKSKVGEPHKWALLDGGDCMIVVPDTDIKPHAWVKEGQKEAELAGMECPCRPKMIYGDGGGYYGKPIIVHNSFEHAEFLDEVMTNFI